MINDKIKSQVGLSVIAEQYDESDGHSKCGQDLSMSHEAQISNQDEIELDDRKAEDEM